MLLEPHFKKYLVHDSYGSKIIKAKKLLTCTRFDIAFKLFFIEMKDRDVMFAKEFYKEHIRAFSLGRFTEPGNEEKDSIEKFFEEFDKTFEAIKANGFDSSKTLIPLSKNGSIANGAHRVASALYLDKNVECVQVETVDHIYNYKFFYNRNVPSSILDAVATKFVEYADNLHMAFIWPTARGRDKEIEKIIPNIVYRKDVSLNPNGAHNLLSQIYCGEEWIGSSADNFRGSQGKLIECFKNLEAVRVIAFQAETLDEVLTIKDKIRDIFNIGKHSIHITDTKEESIRVARVVFNDNSVHFLNHAKPNRYLSTHVKISAFKKFLVENSLNVDDVLLDSSIVLSSYGVREAKDIDFFCFDNDKIIREFDYINIHDEELKNHQESKQELIYNPKNYFYFDDLKFISFAQLYKMKSNRAEQKDKNDCKIMEALIDNDDFKKLLNQLKQKLFYKKMKIRHKLIKLLQAIGLYGFIRNLYRITKG